MICGAGRYRERVQVQQLAEGVDTSGGPTLTWTLRGNRWANIRPMKGDDRFLGEVARNTVSHEIRLRYWSSVTAQDRVVFGSRSFSIASLTNVDELGRELLLLCKEDTSS